MDNDTHPEDIKAALRKRDTSLAELARANNGTTQALSTALRVGNMPRWEKVIAAALGKQPEEVWPKRYAERAKKAEERARRSAEIAAARSRPRRRGRPPIRTTPDAAAARAGSPR